MAKSTNARLSQRILKKDRQIAQAVLDLKGYAPANSDFAASRLQEALENLRLAEAAEAAAQQAAADAREAAVALELALHDLVLGAKQQVIAQYGDDSDEITKLGMKKKSERRYGRPKKAAPEQT
jgi:hypothetical protein